MNHSVTVRYKESSVLRNIGDALLLARPRHLHETAQAAFGVKAREHLVFAALAGGGRHHFLHRVHASEMLLIEAFVDEVTDSGISAVFLSAHRVDDPIEDSLLDVLLDRIDGLTRQLMLENTSDASREARASELFALNALLGAFGDLLPDCRAPRDVRSRLVSRSIDFAYRVGQGEMSSAQAMEGVRRLLETVQIQSFGDVA